MTVHEFLGKLAGSYDKDLKMEQAALYGRKLARFGVAELDLIYEKLVETCRYFPKIADVWNAARDLGLVEKRERTSKARYDCRECEGTGWQTIMSYHSEDGEPYESVTRCECTSLGMPKRPNPPVGPGGWVTEGVTWGKRVDVGIKQLTEEKQMPSAPTQKALEAERSRQLNPVPFEATDDDIPF